MCVEDVRAPPGGLAGQTEGALINSRWVCRSLWRQKVGRAPKHGGWRTGDGELYHSAAEVVLFLFLLFYLFRQSEHLSFPRALFLTYRWRVELTTWLSHPFLGRREKKHRGEGRNKEVKKKDAGHVAWHRFAAFSQVQPGLCVNTVFIHRVHRVHIVHRVHRTRQGTSVIWWVYCNNLWSDLGSLKNFHLIITLAVFLSWIEVEVQVGF